MEDYGELEFLSNGLDLEAGCEGVISRDYPIGEY